MNICRVALDVPLHRLFDYTTVPSLNGETAALIGCRVKVPFRQQSRIAIIVAFDDNSTVAEHKLKAVIARIDETPAISPAVMTLCQWMSQYYHHPLGEVLFLALSPRLRQLKPNDAKTLLTYQLTTTGRLAGDTIPQRAHKQAAIHRLLCDATEPLTRQRLRDYGMNTTLLNAWLSRQWLTSGPEIHQQAECNQALSTPEHLQLNPEQTAAVTTMMRFIDQFRVFLLEGVTGSGKTIVYLKLIQHILTQNAQVLVLLPEISLTPQIVSRFQTALGCAIGLIHSGLSDKKRHETACRIQRGHYAVVVGTRSAIFLNMPRLGLIIVDEEHDSAYKQQDSVRYHARDVAIKRASLAGCPVVLGSATPSLETLHNAISSRYDHIQLVHRYNQKPLPNIMLVDARREPSHYGLCQTTRQAIDSTLKVGGQVLVFINRRGYAPALICEQCHWISLCPQCDIRLTLHATQAIQRCHSCGFSKPVPTHCPSCKTSTVVPVGQGTQRVEESLQRLFPGVSLTRIDSDTTSKRNGLAQALAGIKPNEPHLLVGTQMLAKGHHFPNLRCVCILAADDAFFCSDFQAIERFGQLIVQVAGRAGRAETPGAVYLQTRFATHPIFLPLLQHDYRQFAEKLLLERQSAHLPPFSYMALIRADARNAQHASQFLQQASQLIKCNSIGKVQVLGPISAPQARQQGRFRQQLHVHSSCRMALQRLLQTTVQQFETLPNRHYVRWSVDVDPKDTL